MHYSDGVGVHVVAWRYVLARIAQLGDRQAPADGLRDELSKSAGLGPDGGDR